MVHLDAMARAALNGEALLLRSMVHDLMFNPVQISELEAPTGADRQLAAVAASLVELLAMRAGIAPPAWTAGVPSSPHSVFLLKAAAVMPRLRAACERESPAPLRKRNLFAPANYLEFL